MASVGTLIAQDLAESDITCDPPSDPADNQTNPHQTALGNWVSAEGPFVVIEVTNDPFTSQVIQNANELNVKAFTIDDVRCYEYRNIPDEGPFCADGHGYYISVSGSTSSNGEAFTKLSNAADEQLMAAVIQAIEQS